MAKFDLVFEGGGAKGVVFVGALEALLSAGHTPERMVGTSAGAITATLLAAGYSPAAMLAAATEKLPDGTPRMGAFLDPPRPGDFEEAARESSQTMKMFRSIDMPMIPASVEETFDSWMLARLLQVPPYCQIFNFVECGGIFAGKAFVAWMGEKLAAMGHASGCTLEDFHDATRRDLSLVASDTTDGEMLVLNHRTAPRVPVVMAVRMSMSIPLIWREVVWRPEWGTYMGRDKAGNAIVDGGLLSNFPMHLIATSTPAVREVMGDTDPEAARNLGLLIDEQLSVPGLPAAEPKRFELAMARRIARLVDTMTSARDNETILRHEHEICRLPAKGCGTTDFGMPEERVSALVAAGRHAMRAWLGNVSQANAACA